MAIRLSMAPIAWANDDILELGGETPIEQILKESVEAGFSGTELGARYPQDKQALKEMLEAHNIELSSGWFSGNLLTQSLDDEKKALDKEIEKRLHVNSNIIVYCECSNTIQTQQQTPLSEKPVLSDSEMKEFAENFSELSKHAKAQGMTLAYHFHMGTIIQTAEELDKFLEYGGDDIKLAFDTGHLYFAGDDPMKSLEKHYKHVALVHLKDVRSQVREQVLRANNSFIDSIIAGVYTMPGDGSIDFDPVIKLLSENNYEGWIVVEAEQDPAKAPPLEYAKNTRKYLMGLFDKYGMEVTR